MLNACCAFRYVGVAVSLHADSRDESLKSHLEEVGKDLSEGLDSWKHDAVATWEDFKAEHPDAIADINTGNPTIAHAAEGFDMAVQVLDPLLDPIVDGTHNVLDAVRDELGDTAQQFVEARSEQRGVDHDEVEASRVRVEAARETLDAEVDKGHDAIDAFRDKAHDELDSASHAMHDYADSHPDSHMNDVNPAAITDPHVHDAIQEETQVAEV